jgi:hypothetical protein
MIRPGLFPSIAAAVFILAAVLFSCASQPKPEPSPVPEAQPAVEPDAQAPAFAAPAVEPPKEGPAFDPSAITPEVKQATFVDIRAFIENLNQIIRHKDYEAWLSHLDSNYIAYYSDPAVLEQLSQSLVLQRLGIKLRTLKDYFINVVYPARQNDRVDDVEFIGEKLVKAITISPKGERLVLYSLGKNGDSWKIGIWR